MKYNTKPFDPSKEHLTMDELLKLVRRKSRSTVYDWINEGGPRFKPRFPLPYPGRVLLWCLEELKEYYKTIAGEGNEKGI